MDIKTAADLVCRTLTLAGCTVAGEPWVKRGEHWVRVTVYAGQSVLAREVLEQMGLPNVRTDCTCFEGEILVSVWADIVEPA